MWFQVKILGSYLKLSKSYNVSVNIEVYKNASEHDDNELPNANGAYHRVAEVL